MLCLKGLIVVDAFQAWCGPCTTVVDLFRKVRNEVGSDLLHFAVAEVDSIDALKKYRGKCKPVFLFYAVIHVSSIHAMLPREQVFCSAGMLFQSFPLVLEQSSSVGEEGLVHNTICGVLLW
uniref:Thioredoxin domain-containing protein n=1 Tax=Buteo japonicus TaxID=224669 RepID=A0A8C0BVM8_9AVES